MLWELLPGPYPFLLHTGLGGPCSSLATPVTSAPSMLFAIVLSHGPLPRIKVTGLEEGWTGNQLPEQLELQQQPLIPPNVPSNSSSCALLLSA